MWNTSFLKWSLCCWHHVRTQISTSQILDYRTGWWAVRCYIRIVASGGGKEPHQWRYDFGANTPQQLLKLPSIAFPLYQVALPSASRSTKRSQAPFLYTSANHAICFVISQSPSYPQTETRSFFSWLQNWVGGEPLCAILSFNLHAKANGLLEAIAIMPILIISHARCHCRMTVSLMCSNSSRVEKHTSHWG